MEARQIYTKLVELRNSAGETLYQRLCLARDLLHNKEWVRDPSGGGGDESRALDRLEEECFADVCGAISLVQMLEILSFVPNLVTWKVNKFNLRKMYEEMAARRGKEKRSKAVEKTPEQQTINHLKETIKDLERENRELKRENQKLKRIIHKIRKAQKLQERFMGSLN